MVRRESRATDAAGGREWMLGQIREIVADWRHDLRFQACGIGFGGPVDWPSQRVVLSTHVGGWRDFDLPGFITGLIDAPAVMDNDANVGALGEALYGAGKACSPLFYMTLSTGIGGGIFHDGAIWRGADSYGGEIGHLTIRPDGPECLCGARGCFERMCCGLWLERDYGRPAKELLQDDRLRQTLRSGPGPRPQGRHHAVEPGAHRHRRRHCEGWRPALRFPCARNSAARLPPGPPHAWMCGPRRWATIAYFLGPWLCAQ